MAEVEADGRVTTVEPRQGPAPEAPQPCASCGDPDARQYCPTCGEKRISEADLSLRRFLGEAVHTFTNLESSVFRTFGALLARPGHLTAEYLEGRRKRYIRPLQLFIICNVIFFFVQPYIGLDLLTTPLRTHLQHFYGSLALDLVEARIAARGIAFEDYVQQFNRTAALQARSLVIIMVPIFALLVYAVYGSVRRYFVEHLIFSLHFYAFVLLFSILVTGILFVLVQLLDTAGLQRATAVLEAYATTAVLTVFAAYFIVAARRVYGQSRWLRVIKAAALSTGVFIVLLLYRFILFFTTYLSV